MKKFIVLLLLSSSALLLVGCSKSTTSVVDQTTPASVVEQPSTDINTEVAPIADTTIFDQSQIKFIVDDKLMESYYIYSNVKKYNDGYIGIKIGGNDGISSSLIYSKNGIIIKELKNIFWYDYYNNNNIHEYCDTSLNKCKIAKITECKINNDKNEICVYSFFEYMYSLINGEEINDYFSKKLEEFTK